MAGIRNRGDSGFSTCSAALCTATVSLQAADHSLAPSRRGRCSRDFRDQRHCPNACVWRRLFRCRSAVPITSPRASAARRRRSPARSGGARNQPFNDRRLMAANGAKDIAECLLSYAMQVLRNARVLLAQEIGVNLRSTKVSKDTSSRAYAAAKRSPRAIPYSVRLYGLGRQNPYKPGVRLFTFAHAAWSGPSEDVHRPPVRKLRPLSWACYEIAMISSS